MKTLWVLLLSACGAASVETSIETSRDAVKSGTRDDTRTETVALRIDPELSTGVGLCTATLIAPNVALTARHCVSDLVGSGVGCADETVGGTTWVATRPLAPAPATHFSITAITDLFSDPDPPFTFVREVRVPTTDTGVPLCGNDLALLVLAQPATGRVAGVRAGPVSVGELLTAVGYGNDGAIADSLGLRRSRNGLPVLSIGLVRSPNGRVDATANDFEIDGPCGGDSGGAAFDDTGLVVGVMSRGSPTVCEGMTYTQITPHFEWLAAEVRGASVSAGLAIPGWAAVAQPDAGAAVDSGIPDVVTLTAAEVAQQPPAQLGCVTAPTALCWLLVLGFLRRAR